MWSRRAFIVASCGIVTCGVTEAIAGLGAGLASVAGDWLYTAVRFALKNLDKFSVIVFRLGDKVDILINVKATILDVRRKVTDSTPEHHLNVKLKEWLNRYDQWVSNKQKPGESDSDFVARHERERVILNNDWSGVAGDAVGALKDIESLGYELQSIQSKAMSFEEWHQYTELMDKEKMIIEVINSQMPTDPIVINRLRETSTDLADIVKVIDQIIVPLDDMIAKYGK